MPPTVASPGLTPPEIARQTGAPLWAVRRVIDRLHIAARVGLTRLVPHSALETVRTELQRGGYIPEQGGPDHATP